VTNPASSQQRSSQKLLLTYLTPQRSREKTHRRWRSRVMTLTPLYPWSTRRSYAPAVPGMTPPATAPTFGASTCVPFGGGPSGSRTACLCLPVSGTLNTPYSTATRHSKSKSQSTRQTIQQPLKAIVKFTTFQQMSTH
jgi:hypothetical protein